MVIRPHPLYPPLLVGEGEDVKEGLTPLLDALLGREVSRALYYPGKGEYS